MHPLMLAPLEHALNLAARGSSRNERLLHDLDGRRLRIEVQNPDARVDCTFRHGRMELRAGGASEVDVTVRGRAADLLRAAMQRRNGGSLPRDIELRGDMETAQRVQELLGRLELDWEEELARITGDPLAHHLGLAARRLGAWAKAAGGTLMRDTGEYLREESGQLPRRTEVKAFLDDVDRLRADVDRFEARFDRIAGRHGGHRR